MFNDKLFAVEYHQGAIMYTIHQLDGVSMESINRVDVMLTEPLQDTAVPVLSSNANYLISGAPVVKLFDDELIEKPLNNHQQSDPIKMYHYGYHTPLGDALVVNNNHYTSRINYDYNFSVFNLEYNYWINLQYGNDAQTIPKNLTKELAIIEGDTVTYRFKANDHLYIDELYVNPSSETLTMVAYDKLRHKRGLYQLDNQPQINHLVNGSWYNPDYPNQGLSIAKGVRHDGSEYVYLTAYLFRNGKPLWAAGVADLINYPKTLNIPLYEFNGPQLLEADQNANQEIFGDISLTFSGCDALQTTINNGEHSETITFYRANNVNQKIWCQ